MAKKPEEYSDKETAKRRDEVIRRMLKTPPKPRKAKITRVGKKAEREKSAR